MLDSGATRHFTPRKSDIIGLELFPSPKAVQIGKNNVQVHALGKGSVKINDMLTLPDVWYLPDSPFRIISTNQLTASGHPIVMVDDVACIVKDDTFIGAFTKNACGLLILNDNVMQSYPPTLSLALKHLHSRSSIVSNASHANCVVDAIGNDVQSDMLANVSSVESKNTLEVDNVQCVAKDLHLIRHVNVNTNPTQEIVNVNTDLPTTVLPVLSRYQPARFQAGQYDTSGQARQLQFGTLAQHLPFADFDGSDPLCSPMVPMSVGAETLQVDSPQSSNQSSSQTLVNGSTVNGQRKSSLTLVSYLHHRHHVFNLHLHLPESHYPLHHLPRLQNHLLRLFSSVHPTCMSS
jgi:hypothetical protein